MCTALTEFAFATAWQPKADLGIVLIIKVAMLAHDPCIGAGKTDLFLVLNGVTRFQGFFAGFKRRFRVFDFGQTFCLEDKIFG